MTRDSQPYNRSDSAPPYLVISLLRVTGSHSSRSISYGARLDPVRHRSYKTFHPRKCLPLFPAANAPVPSPPPLPLPAHPTIPTPPHPITRIPPSRPATRPSSTAPPHPSTVAHIFAVSLLRAISHPLQSRSARLESWSGIRGCIIGLYVGCLSGIRLGKGMGTGKPWGLVSVMG